MHKVASLAYDMSPGVLSWLAANTELAVANRGGEPLPEEQWASGLPGCRGVLVGSRDSVTPSLLERAGRGLVVVSSNSVGYEHMTASVEHALEHGILLLHTPGVACSAVAGFVDTAMGLFRRRQLEGHEEVLGGGWTRARGRLVRSGGLREATLGIIGIGRIGSEIARRAGARGMTVLAHDIHPHRPSTDQLRTIPGLTSVDLDELLARADIITLHVDLNPHSHHLIDEAALAQIQPGTGLINTSRGGVVDSLAVARALETGRLGWAALDVLEEEPTVPESLLAIGREGTPGAGGRLLLTPHIAGGTAATRDGMAEAAARAMLAALDGHPPLELDLIPPLRRQVDGGFVERVQERRAWAGTDS